MAIVPRLRSAAEIIFSLYTAKKTKTRCAQTVGLFSCFLCGEKMLSLRRGADAVAP
jgi:hypothetical protein